MRSYIYHVVINLTLINNRDILSNQHVKFFNYPTRSENYKEAIINILIQINRNENYNLNKKPYHYLYHY